MPVVGPGQMAIEKSPSYLITPRAPERVHRMDPKVGWQSVVQFGRSLTGEAGADSAGPRHQGGLRPHTDLHQVPPRPTK